MKPRCEESCCIRSSSVFFLDVTYPPVIYTLSLHDALPILKNYVFSRQPQPSLEPGVEFIGEPIKAFAQRLRKRDRKSTRLNSSHRCISYAVFCLKKKK